jgi:uncharacterized membrane protein
MGFRWHTNCFIIYLFIYCMLHHNSDTTCSLTILIYTSLLHILDYYVSITILGCQMGLN